MTISLATGAVAAAVLTFVVLPDAAESAIVGADLTAFGLAWALFGRLARRAGTSARWAWLPAAVLSTTGLTLLVFAPGEPVMTRAALVWAPALIALAAWIGVQNHRHGGRLLVHAIAASTLLAGLGGLYQATTSPPEVAAGPMPGRLVDVGGYRLHLNCTGTGAPAVVLLNGLGETSPAWARIGPAIARTTRVCVYDRAGQGWSEDSPNPADAAHAVLDLHRLLAVAGEHGPFVLAGHSTGGIHALTYAARFPADVAGVALLDSASPHQVELVTPFRTQYQLMRRGLAVAPTLLRFGAGHAITAIGRPALPGAAGHQAAVFANSPRGLRNLRAEQSRLPVAFEQARALVSLGDRPLFVLTASDNADHLPGWAAAQDALAGLSANTRHTVAAATHLALLEDPAGAARSAAAITAVVFAARTHTSL